MKSSTLLVLTVSYLAITSPPLLIGCIDDGTTGTSASSSGSTTGDAGTTTNAKACDDTCTALANAEVACGDGDFAAEKASAISQLAGGNCNNVTIMDVTSLYNQCIPSFSTISCDDLANGRLDYTCAGQIIKQ